MIDYDKIFEKAFKQHLDTGKIEEELVKELVSVLTDNVKKDFKKIKEMEDKLYTSYIENLLKVIQEDEKGN